MGSKSLADVGLADNVGDTNILRRMGDLVHTWGVEDFYRRFGKMLQAARKNGAEQLTQAELAERVEGLSRSSIANVEKGRQRLRLHFIESLAEALGIDPRELLPPRPTSPKATTVEALEKEGAPPELISKILPHIGTKDSD